MTAHGVGDEIEMPVRSRHGLIVVDSLEDDRVEEALRHVASRLSLHHYVLAADERRVPRRRQRWVTCSGC